MCACYIHFVTADMSWKNTCLCRKQRKIIEKYHSR